MNTPRRLGVLAALALAALCLCRATWAADAPADQAGLTPEQRRLNLESFEKVWKTVGDTYYDPDLEGLDWEAVRDEFRPKVEKAGSQKAVRKLLQEMIDRLGKTHFAIVPGEVYDTLAEGKKRGGRGVPGFEVRVVDGKAVVFRVWEGQPAARLGVRPGWELVEVDGERLGPELEKVRESFRDSPQLQRELTVAVLRRLRGERGGKLPVVFRDGADREVKLDVPLVEPQGSATTIGHMPTIHVHFESKKLDGGIVYYSLNTFADPVRVMPAFEKLVRDNLDARGFIIDVRGNPGGLGLMAAGLGNWFVGGPTEKLGTMVTRGGKLNFILNQRAKTYGGPLAILVDGLSGSTSEIFAGGLQDLGRARVFGTRTMAAALPSVFVRLPNGDGFQYAIANYISVGGKELEGRGVHPDEVVPLTRAALLEGRDPALDAAAEWIRRQGR